MASTMSSTTSLSCSSTAATMTTSAAATTATTAAAATGDDDSYEDIDDCKDEIDPRVKIELETLNQSATDINRLEKEIDEARAKYQTTFSECSQQLEQLKKKFGGSIKRARPYYELKESAREAQSEALRSARKFQTANGVYLAAKETISLAELRLMDDKAASLSAAWQEMLNHALSRVMEAEKEKSVSEKEHLKRAAVFADVENKMHLLEKKHKKSIAKARSYFEAKKELEVKLQQVKQSVEDLQQAMQGAKQRYSGALKRLENISDGIHEKRRQKIILMFPREPGVGAEENVDVSEIESKLPNLSSVGDVDGHGCFYDDYDDDDVYYDESDDEDDGYNDIDNESVFRAKVLTTSLDDEDTSFMKLKGGAKKRGKKPLKRTQSLPVYSGHRTSKQNEERVQQVSYGSEHCSMEEVFEKPLVPLSDRSESCPPDGDSLSSEKNIAWDLDSSESTDDFTEGNVISQSDSSAWSKSNGTAQSQSDVNGQSQSDNTSHSQLDGTEHSYSTSEQTDQVMTFSSKEVTEPSNADSRISQHTYTSEPSVASNGSRNEPLSQLNEPLSDVNEPLHANNTDSKLLLDEVPHSETSDENCITTEQHTSPSPQDTPAVTDLDSGREQVKIDADISKMHISEPTSSENHQLEIASPHNTPDVPQSFSTQVDADNNHGKDDGDYDDSDS